MVRSFSQHSKNGREPRKSVTGVASAGTPLAILGAIGRAARDGAIIKGGQYLEKMTEVDTILLDKTGTLTYGTPEVVEIRPADGVTEEFLLESAAIEESQSEHPVAKAILNRASQMEIRVCQPDRFDYTWTRDYRRDRR